MFISLSLSFQSCQILLSNCLRRKKVAGEFNFQTCFFVSLFSNVLNSNIFPPYFLDFCFSGFHDFEQTILSLVKHRILFFQWWGLEVSMACSVLATHCFSLGPASLRWAPMQVSLSSSLVLESADSLFCLCTLFSAVGFIRNLRA